MEEILKLTNISKRFGGLEVLNGVNLSLQKGMILGLIGPNGAGKTTLFNIISGALMPDSGEIKLRDQNITHWKPEKRCNHGITRTFQIPKPFADLTVGDNIEVGVLFGSDSDSRVENRQRAYDWLDRVGLTKFKNVKASELSLGGRKKLEVVRAISTAPEVLLLDEVMGGLAPGEVDEVSELVTNLPSEGITVIFVEHVLRAVMNIAHEVTVLNRGNFITSGVPQEVVKNPDVIEAYLGRMHKEQK